MSVEAISWALAQPVKHSTAKFVLVVMANCADSDMVCWPSASHICEQTSQDRKTVQENVRRLREMGYIEDTGERKGSTKQVIVYRLKTPENGAVKEAQKRNSTENGTGPNFPIKRPVFPAKEAQISPETGPKTGGGTVIEPSMEPSGKRHKAPAPEIELPDWVPLDAWNGFLAMRKAIKKAVTADGLPLALKKLNALRLAGQDPRAVLEQSTMNNYQGLFEVKGSNQGRAPPGRQPDVDEINRQAKEALFGKKKECIDV